MPRILLVKTSSMGDVVHNLPLATDIARHVPDAHIDWVVEEGFADVPALHPAVRRVIPVAIRRWRRTPFARATWREARAFLNALRMQRYDVVLDSQGLVKSSLIAAGATGPAHGYDRACAREPLAALLYAHTYYIARSAHAVERNRALGAAALRYDAPTGAPDYGIRAHATPIPLPANYAVFLHATSRDSKLWPESDWVELGIILAGGGMAIALPWGSRDEHVRAQRLAARIPAAIVLPRLGLDRLARVLQDARAVVGVDTGLVHLAAALDRPTVAIYTDTDPALTGVLARDSALARNLGGRRESPSPTDVVNALTQMQVLAR